MYSRCVTSSASCISASRFQTVTSLYEAVVPPSEKCINYVKSVEVSRSEEKALSPEPEEVVGNGVVETKAHLTLVDEPEESLADEVVVERATALSQTILQDKREKEVPVEVELVELTTSVNESLQFPEIEEILDSGKTSEFGEVCELDSFDSIISLYERHCWIRFPVLKIKKTKNPGFIIADKIALRLIVIIEI